MTAAAAATETVPAAVWLDAAGAIDTGTLMFSDAGDGTMLVTVNDSQQHELAGGWLDPAAALRAAASLAAWAAAALTQRDTVSS